jgi:hypothetical protein
MNTFVAGFPRGTVLSKQALLTMFAVAAIAGCDCGTTPTSCRSSIECGSLVCVDGRCVPAPAGSDVGVRPDAFRPMGGCVDTDGDMLGTGCALGPDCDDTNRLRGGAEICDTIDNDCDMMVDETFAGVCVECTADCEALPTVPGMGGWMPGPATSDGVIVDADGALTLGRTMSESFSVWVANTDEATVSKMDSRTNREIARYPSVGASAPAGARPWNEACNYASQGNCPSRTAVDQNFDAYVANRAFGNVGTVTKYANQESDCVDRNANGVIDTSRDMNGDGIIQLGTGEFIGPADECILYTTAVGTGSNLLPRALTVGVAGVDQLVGNVWVGLFNGQEGCELDSATGATIRCISIAPLRSYGGTSDASGRIWFVSRASSAQMLGYINPATGVFTMASNAPTPGGCNPDTYGISADGSGHLYIAITNCSPSLFRYTIATDTWDTYDLPGGGSPRGVAADETSLWIGLSHNAINFEGGLAQRILQFRLSDMSFVRSWTLPTGLGTVGVGVSFDGSVWAIAQGSNLAARLDPVAGTWIEHPVGLTPYTYSDFIGFGLNTFAQPRGHHRFVSEGCEGTETTRWQGLRLRVERPAGTRVEVWARSADTRAALEPLPWVGPFAVDGAGLVNLVASPGPFEGRFIEIDLRLSTDDRRVAPRIFSVDSARTCGGGIS